MDPYTAVSATIPKIAFFAQVGFEGGDTYGPRTYSYQDYKVPTGDEKEAEAFLRAKGIDFSHIFMLRRWTVSVTIASGEEIELKSEPVRGFVDVGI